MAEGGCGYDDAFLCGSCFTLAPELVLGGQCVTGQRALSSCNTLSDGLFPIFFFYFMYCHFPPPFSRVLQKFRLSSVFYDAGIRRR